MAADDIKYLSLMVDMKMSLAADQKRTCSTCSLMQVLHIWWCLKMGVPPQNILHFPGMFHFLPSILGYPPFTETIGNSHIMLRRAASELPRDVALLTQFLQKESNLTRNAKQVKITGEKTVETKMFDVLIILDQCSSHQVYGNSATSRNSVET